MYSKCKTISNISQKYGVRKTISEEVQIARTNRCICCNTSYLKGGRDEK